MPNAFCGLVWGKRGGGVLSPSSVNVNITVKLLNYGSPAGICEWSAKNSGTWILMDSTEVLSNEQVYVHFHAEYCSYLAVELTVSKLKRSHSGARHIFDKAHCKHREASFAVRIQGFMYTERKRTRKVIKSGSVKLHIGDSWGRKVTTHKCPRINVLNVETEPRMGDGDNRTNGKFEKLNQWKICISGFFECRKVTTQMF